MAETNNKEKGGGGGYKKSAPASAPAGIFETTDPTEVIGFLLFMLLIGGIVIERVVSFATGKDPFLVAAHNFAIRLVAVFTPISIVISGLLIFGIFYALRELTKVRQELNLRFHSHKDPIAEHAIFESKSKKRWEKILDYLESSNMSDWKIAILEADIMLEEMVDRIGYPGESLGEKLKNVERSDFNTVDKAWEAHKIRNTIAHEGQSFTITLGEARRIIGLFEEVFQEFRYI